MQRNHEHFSSPGRQGSGSIWTAVPALEGFPRRFCQGLPGCGASSVLSLDNASRSHERANQTEYLKTDLNSALEHTFENSFELFLTKIIIVAKAAGDFKWNLQFLCYVSSEGSRYV